MKLKTFLLAFFILFAAGKAEATRYWVSASGGSTCGSAQGTSDPGVYITIAVARTCTYTSGDEVYLKPGNYTAITLSNNTVWFDPPSGVTIRGSDPDKANWPVLAPSGSSVRFFFFNTSRSNVTFKYLKLDYVNATSANSCIGSTSGTGIVQTNIVIEDIECKGKGVTEVVNGPGAWGFGTGHSNGVLRRTRAWNFQGMRQQNLGPHCLYLQGDNNIVEYNECDGFYGYAYQIYSSGTERPNNNIIRYNVFKNFPRRLGYVQSGTTGNQIYGNINHSLGTGTYAEPANINATLRGTNTLYAHNTHYSTASGSTGITAESSCSGCKIINNLLSVLGTATVNNAGAGATFTTNKTTGATACMINPGAGNFALISGSACADAGTAIAGFPFNGSAPDQGAFETVPAPTLATATPSGVSVGYAINQPNQVPILPASGGTGFTLSAATAGNATRTSDGVLRVPYTGATCATTEAGTISYSSSTGNVSTAKTIGDPNTTNYGQPMFSFGPLAISNNCGTLPTDPPPGLHVHYKFDEGTGTSVNDETANNIDGTITGATWVAGRTGSALNFVANSTDNVAFGFGSGVNPSTQNMTIAFDFQPTGASSNDIYFGAPLGSSQSLLIGRDGASSTLGIAIQGSAIGSNTEFPIVEGQWYRACLRMNATTDVATLYMQGIAGTSAQSVKSYTSYALTGNFEIGRLPTNNTDGRVMIDNFKLWTSLESCEDDFASEWPITPSASTFEQLTYQWYLLRKDGAGNQIKLPSPSSAVNTAIRVPSGAVMTLEMQINEKNTADPDPLSLVLQSDLNGSGVFSDVPDTLVGNAAFYGTADANSAIPSGVPACPLSGALTCVDGGTQRTQSAVPVVDFAQNNSTVLRYLIQVAGNNDDVIRFRLRKQGGNALDTYTQYPTALISAAYAAAP